MSKEAFEAIKEGLESAISFARGQQDGHDVHEVEVRDVDVKAVRARLGMSQDDFARAFGVSPATVRNWEQGRRHPHGPARVLLAVIEQEPEVVQRVMMGMVA
jgi:putative transcriptional regulator